VAVLANAVAHVRIKNQALKDDIQLLRTDPAAIDPPAFLVTHPSQVCNNTPGVRVVTYSWL
jgi:hypothetical protein